MSEFKLPSGIYTKLPEIIPTAKATLDFIASISQSVVDDEYYHFVRAMQQIIPSVDIEELTIPDFYALVAYARILTFPDSPISIDAYCKGTVFDTQFGILTASQVKEKIGLGEMDRTEHLRPRLCNNLMQMRVTEYSQLTVVPFDYKLPEFAEVPRVSLLPEWKRLIRESRYRFIIPTVAWLKEGDTLEDKMAILREDLDTFDKLSKLKDDAVFGVSSRFTSICPCCGHASVVPIHLDNTSFIREV